MSVVVSPKFTSFVACNGCLEAPAKELISKVYLWEEVFLGLQASTEFVQGSFEP